MTHIYGIDAKGLELESAASQIAARISSWAEEVDKQARFPEESLAALAEGYCPGIIKARSLEL